MNHVLERKKVRNSFIKSVVVKFDMPNGKILYAFVSLYLLYLMDFNLFCCLLFNLRWAVFDVLEFALPSVSVQFAENWMRIVMFP